MSPNYHFLAMKVIARANIIPMNASMMSSLYFIIGGLLCIYGWYISKLNANSHAPLSDIVLYANNKCNLPICFCPVWLQWKMHGDVVILKNFQFKQQTHPKSTKIKTDKKWNSSLVELVFSLALFSLGRLDIQVILTLICDRSWESVIEWCQI